MLVDTEEPKRPLAADQYWAPATSDIRLEDGCLFWEPTWPNHGSRRITPTVETFVQFLKLAESDSDRVVLRYARRWGVLNLCKNHGEPVTHQHPPCIPFVRPYVNAGEPITEWRRLSRIAGAIMRTSAKVYEGQTGDSDDWETLKTDRSFGWQMENPFRSKLELHKAGVVGAVNRWLELGNVRPTLRWNSPDPSLILAGRGGDAGLFAALGVQLLENSGSYVIVACTGCRRFFDASPNQQDEGRKRRPKTGQGRYCRECIEAGVPVIMAKRRKMLGLSRPRKPPKRRKDRRK
jgi:hypothetical protein